MYAELETPKLIDTPVILTEGFTNWIIGDFEASYIADNIGEYKDKHDMAIGVLGDWIPLYYIKNWKDIKPDHDDYQFYYISEVHIKENEDE